MNVCRRIWLFRLAAVLFMAAAPFRTSLAQTDPNRVIEVRIEGRKVVAPEGPLRVTEGDVVELRWTGDESVELHLHGYDIEIRISPGEPAVSVVEAHATGRFPITSHGWGGGGHGHETLTYLEVYPR